jgi:hypothetical protein
MNGTKLGSSKILGIVVSLSSMLLSHATASAAVTGQLLGTAAPGAVIDGVSMTPFPADSNPIGQYVFSVTSPLGGSVEFDDPTDYHPMVHWTIGNGWSTWGHGYSGDVYIDWNFSSLTMNMPANTRAFYLYAEPNNGTLNFTLTATGSNGGQFVLNDSIFAVSSAKGFFFKADGETLTSIHVAFPGDTYAIGEFGIAVPGPGALALLGVAGVMGPRGRRRRC